MRKQLLAAHTKRLSYAQQTLNFSKYYPKSAINRCDKRGIK